MERASKAELTQRINRAFFLLERNITPQQIIRRLKEEFGVSEIQAYRYVRQAQKNPGVVPIPEPTKIFTTKLAYSLIARVRAFSKSVGQPMTEVISQALADYLTKEGNGQKEEEQTGRT